MQFASVLLLASLFFICDPALAQKSKSKTKSGKNVVTLQDNEISSESSEAKRENQKFYGTLGLGFMPYLVGTVTIGGTFDPSTLVEVGMSNYEGESTDEHDKSTLIHLNIRRFLGNSFNVSNGLLLTSHSYENRALDDEGSFVAKGTQKTVSYELRLGNAWQWDHFMLGVDWLGAHLSLHDQNSASEHSTRNGAQLVKIHERMDRDRGVRVSFLRIFFGFSF